MHRLMSTPATPVAGLAFEGRELHHAALGPATARADQLDVAMRPGEVNALPPHGSLTWRVTLVVGQAVMRVRRSCGTTTSSQGS